MSRPLCISTLDLHFFQHGGVVTKALVFAQIAKEEGFSPFFLTPSLPLHQTVRRKLQGKTSSTMVTTEFQGYPCYQFGAFYPELEFNAHYFDPSEIQKIMNPTTPCFAVSGNNHAARPFLEAEVPFKIWPGSTFWEDCRHRISQSPWSLRKLLDLASKPKCEDLEREIFSKATRIVVDTLYTHNHVKSFNPAWIKKTTVIPVPVDCEKYRPIENPSRKHLLFMGRLSDPRKNLDLLLEAFTQSAKIHSTINLILIGSGDEETHFKLQNHPFSQRIQWLKNLSEAQKIESIQHACALVIPSLQEGFGIVGAEALACGVPVISTPCGGTADYVIHEETGIQLQGFSAQEMTQAIQGLTQNMVFQNKLALNARAFALKHLSIQAVRPALQEFIHK